MQRALPLSMSADCLSLLYFSSQPILWFVFFSVALTSYFAALLEKMTMEAGRYNLKTVIIHIFYTGNKTTRPETQSLRGIWC